MLPENGNFTDPHNHYTLTGKEFDENTGLVWFGARHYEPETGVWMGQDVYRGEIVLPESLHRYMYVYDNPMSYYDFYGFSGLNFQGISANIADKLGGSAGPLLGAIVNMVGETTKADEKNLTKTIINISYEYIKGTAQVAANAVSKTASVGAKRFFSLADIQKNMWDDYEEQGLGIKECLAPSNIADIATTFVEQPDDMVRYSWEFFWEKTFPNATAAIIKWGSADIVDIKSQDVNDFLHKPIEEHSLVPSSYYVEEPDQDASLIEKFLWLKSPVLDPTHSFE